MNLLFPARPVDPPEFLLRLASRTCFAAMAIMVGLSVSSPPVFAQPYPVDGRVIGTVQGGGLHLQCYLDMNPWGWYWGVTPSGIDVYRRAVSSTCGSWERITDAPVAWNWIDDPHGWYQPHMSFELDDVTAQPGQGYMYQARAVDANRAPIPENVDISLGVATHGVALLGHGTLLGGPGGCGENWVQQIYNCFGECFPAGLRFDAAPAVAPYINSGTSVLVYGSITGYISYCGFNEVIAYLSAASPAECVVGVQETTWGRVKSLYR